MFRRIILAFLIVVSLAYGKDKLVLATDAFEPFYGPDLVNNGFFAEIVKESFEIEGIDVEFEFVPWKRALELATIGNYDGLLGAFHTDEREKYFHYSKGIYENTVSIFALKDIDIDYKDLRSIGNSKIGVVRDYSYSSEFDNATFLNKVESATPEQSINLLYNKRIEFLIGSEDVTKKLISDMYGDDAKEFVVVAQLSKRWLHILISKEVKKGNDYVEVFNKGLDRIMTNGDYYKILDKHKIDS